MSGKYLEGTEGYVYLDEDGNPQVIPEVREQLERLTKIWCGFSVFVSSWQEKLQSPMPAVPKKALILPRTKIPGPLYAPIQKADG